MTVDVATLGIAVDATAVDDATVKLNNLTSAGKQAERATDALATTSKGSTGAVGQFTNEVEKLTAGAGFSRMQMLELGHVTKSVVDSMIAGASPFRALSVEAGRLGEIIGQSGGLTAALRGLWLVILPFVPILLAIAGVVGVVGGAFLLFNRVVAKNLGDVTKTMNLTSTQLAKLKKDGVDTGVTIGDTWKGLTKTISDTFSKAFAPQIAYMKKLFSDLFASIVSGAVAGIRALVGGMTGAYAAIKAVWAMLPSAMGDIIVQTVNTILAKVDVLINKVIDKLNPLLTLAGLDPLQQHKTAPLNNPNAGAANKAVNTATGAFKGGYDDGVKAVNQFGTDWQKNTAAAARARITDAAGDAGKSKKGKVDHSYEDAIQNSKDFIEQLKQETAEIGKNEYEIARMRAEREAAQAPTKQLRDEIMKTYDVWEEASKKQDALDEAIAAYNKMSWEQVDVLQLLKEAAADTAAAYANHFAILSDGVHSATNEFASLFGTTGQGFADMIDGITSYAQAEVDANARILDARAKYKDGSLELIQAEADARAQLKNSELESYGQIIHGVKNVFSEKSAAYKLLSGIEKAYAAIRLAIQIKDLVMTGVLTTARVAGATTAIAVDAAHTGASVANSGLRAAADGIAAIAKAIASLPFPLNLVAGAATAAALVAFGVKVFGGGSGGASATATAASTGPTDYTRQDSPYSVLTTNSGGSNGRYANDNMQAPANNGGITIVHQTTNHINGGDPQELQQTLAYHQADTIQKTREAVRADQIALATRQRIGGRIQ